MATRIYFVEGPEEWASNWIPYCPYCHGPLTVVGKNLLCRCCDRTHYRWEAPCPHRRVIR